MTPEDRRNRIVELVRARERVTVDALADLLDASRETIRRDLSELDARGWLRKFHGGASLPEPGLYGRSEEGPFSERMRQNTAAKRAIARRAISLFRPGDSLFIDTGTTTLLFAEEIARSRDLTVITNSAQIASLVARGEGNSVFLIGGRYREAGAENLGTMAVEQVRRFHALHAVLTVGAIDESGISDFDEEEAELARAMIERARRVTVLADASKVACSSLFAVAPLPGVHRLITDAAPSGAMEKALVSAGVDVVLSSEGGAA
ncbi:DeoR family transcriptional regulator [Terrihabitans soli]|uniref:DeoR family transcriptional regulator n=1 Tax=Terrihabitans soli TaxID=708113 RepID=A0A6S6QGX4_9HYPH|nr:DeoR/GlpR family DNA-binding transcription regulator [Terrihabitans soli]BCJ90403.1 DeoR family transcriptional regulator [Terrihabitans soli]